MQDVDYLAQLLVIGSLLDKIEDLGGERLMMKCQWSGVGTMCNVHRKKNTCSARG